MKHYATPLLIGILFTILQTATCINTSFAQCEDWVWARNSGGNNEAFEGKVITDPSGNVYMANSFDSTYAVVGNDTLWNAGPDSTNDVFAVKYDANGNILWTTSFHANNWEEVGAIATDPSGNFLISIRVESDTLVFGNDTVFGAFTGQFMILVKFDPSGNLIWVSQSNRGDPRALTTDAQGNIYFVGKFKQDTVFFAGDTIIDLNAIDENCIFVMKLDPNGNAIWSDVLGFEDEFSDITLDPFGNVYHINSFRNDTIVYNNDLILNNGPTGTNDIILFKWDNNGNRIWYKHFGGTADDSGRGIVTDDQGNVYCSGYFNSPTLDIGQITLSQPGTINAYIFKIDPAGNVIWAQASNCPSLAASFTLSINDENELYMPGIYDSQFLTFGAYTLTNNGSFEMFLVKYNSAGNVLWATSMGGTGIDAAMDVDVDPFGNVYVTGGYGSSQVIFGADTINYTGLSDFDFFVAKLSDIKLSLTTTDATCGVTNGSATVSAVGGTPPYSYAWSSGDTLPLADSLASGVYMITVTDAKGCTGFAIAMINDIGAANITLNTLLDVTCNGNGDGVINLSVSGGTAPYDYSWSNGATTEDINGLMAGPYELIVTDANGCVTIASYVIIEPGVITIAANAIDPSCGNNDGNISIGVAGGTSPFTYNWSTGGTTNAINNLAAGVYVCTVTDANNCVDSIAVALTDSTAPTITINTITFAGCGLTNGQIFITLSGGNLPYFYLWSNGSSFEDQLALGQGLYYLTVTDGNNCVATGVFEIEETLPITDPVCLVTVDSVTNTNLIVWEKTALPGLDHYNIYRETTIPDVYFLIGSKDYDSLSVFVDSLADPIIHSWRYKISLVDTCGNESEMSTEHKTMHLTANDGVGGTVNLIWDHYEGYSFPTYYINRYSPLNGWEVLDSVQSNLTSFTDLTPPFGGVEYFVETRPPSSCAATRASFNSSRSNKSENIGPGSGVNELNNGIGTLKVYPNPNLGVFNLEMTLQKEESAILHIYNMQGQLVYSENLTGLFGMVHKEIDLSRVAAGIYQLQLITDSDYLHAKIVIE